MILCSDYVYKRFQLSFRVVRPSSYEAFPFVGTVCSQRGNNPFPRWESAPDSIYNVVLLHRFPLLAWLSHPLEVGSFLDEHDLQGSHSILGCANAVGIRVG